jgi:class 3 adenylate cyclase
MNSRPVQYATTSDGVSIAWNEVGEGQAILYFGPIPFTHAREHWTIFEGFFGALARSFRVIYFDARGTGMSEREISGVSHATLLMDAEAVMDAAKLDRFVAYSGSHFSMLGSWTALSLATALPERVTQVVLDSPFLNMGELDDTPFGRVGPTLAQTDWDVYVQTIFRVLSQTDNHAPVGDLMANAAVRWVDAQVGLEYTTLSAATDLGDLLSHVQQPTIVLAYDPGLTVPARCSQRIAAKIRGAQFMQHSDPTYVQMAGFITSFVLPSSAVPPGAAAAPSVPSAFRTVLFTDIVGHTEMMQRLGDAKGRDVLREHERITRETLKAHGGAEVKTMGDGFMASFGSVTSAMECAIALQRAFTARDAVGAQPAVPAVEAISIRIGLNAGEPIEEDGDLFGATVILASRIAAKAGAGEILVPDTVRGLLSGKNFLFADRGEVAMKGFDDAVRLYEVRWRPEGSPLAESPKETGDE